MVTRHGEERVLGVQPRHCVCTNASRGLSAIAEFLVLSAATSALSRSARKIASMLPLTGHFLLTNLLLDDLRKAAENGDARVVVVTSALHDTCCKRTRSKRRLRCCSSTRNCFSTSGNLVYTAASNPRTA